MEDSRFRPPGFLRPPALEDADPADPSTPEWILLDFRAYFAKRINATTATCKIAGDKEIQATFFPAHPPRVSYFCFYCSGVDVRAFGHEPRVVATDANLVLLRVSIGSRNAMIGRDQFDYYIYNAEGPSLEQLPHPMPTVFYDEQVGLLSRGKSYTVVALRDDACAFFRGSSVPGEYDVCLHSEDKVWTTKAVTVPPDQQRKSDSEEFRHDTTNVIAVGGEGGTMAFVDMKHGMLLYDVLSGDPLLRYIKFPQQLQQMPPDQRRYTNDPSITRDIALVQGSFKFVEAATMMRRASGAGRYYDTDCWVVSTYSMKAISSQDESWCPERKVLSTKITADFNLLSEGNSPQHIEDLLIGHPMHSLQDDVVYGMAKFESVDSRAWMLWT